MMVIKNQRLFSDYLGIISSFLCIVHCLIAPAVFSLQFLFLSTSSSFEIIEYLFVGLSLIAVIFSSKRFKRVFSKATLWVTFFVFASSIFYHEAFPPYVSYLSSAILILLHFQNIFYKKIFAKA